MITNKSHRNKITGSDCARKMITIKMPIEKTKNPDTRETGR